MSKFFESKFLNKTKQENEPFLWYPYLPKNACTLLSGTGGSGKSYFALDMASKLILNEKLGNGVKGDLGRSNVAYISTEETASNSLDRLSSLFSKAKQEKIKSRILFINIKSAKRNHRGEGILNLSNPDMRDDFFRELDKNKVGLVIFDPLTSFIGQNRNNASGIREAFEGLNSKLIEYNITALSIAHLTKPTGKSSEFRVMGSTEWISCSRSAMMMAVDVNEPSVTYVAINKGNNVPELQKGRFLAYQKDGNKGSGLMFNDDLISDDFDFSDHVRGKQPKTKKWEMAYKLIVQILSDPKWKDGISLGNRNTNNHPVQTIFGQFTRMNRGDLVRMGSKAIVELEAKGLVERVSIKYPLTPKQRKRVSKNPKRFRTHRRKFVYRIPAGKLSKIVQLDIERILKNKLSEEVEK